MGGGGSGKKSRDGGRENKENLESDEEQDLYAHQTGKVLEKTQE